MFQTRLKELREHAGYSSQQSFADAFGVAQSTVGGWESGKREPKFDTTIRLADFFGVTLDYLLGHAERVAQSPAKASKLSVTEQALLCSFRQLNSDGQRRIAELTDDLVAGGRTKTKTPA